MADKKYRKPKCYCGTALRPDGACPFSCPPSAHPRNLRRQMANARKLDRRPQRLDVLSMSHEERRRMGVAVAKLGGK